MGIYGYAVSLTSLDLNDPIASQAALLNMSSGINIALYTTLIGQICNVLLSMQTFNLEQELNREKS